MQIVLKVKEIGTACRSHWVELRKAGIWSIDYTNAAYHELDIDIHIEIDIVTSKLTLFDCAIDIQNTGAADHLSDVNLWMSVNIKINVATEMSENHAWCKVWQWQRTSRLRWRCERAVYYLEMQLASWLVTCMQGPCQPFSHSLQLTSMSKLQMRDLLLENDK